MITIDAATAAQIKALATEVRDQMLLYEGLIALNFGSPVDWDDVDRQTVLKDCTLMVFNTSLDLACYPLSTAAVVFIP